jgi:hypothetical protein
MAEPTIIDLEEGDDQVQPDTKRQYQQNGKPFVPSQNQKALDDFMFDWSSDRVEYVTEPSWKQVTSTILSKEHPPVPQYPVPTLLALSTPQKD